MSTVKFLRYGQAGLSGSAGGCHVTGTLVPGGEGMVGGVCKCSGQINLASKGPMKQGNVGQRAIRRLQCDGRSVGLQLAPPTVAEPHMGLCYTHAAS